MKTNELIGTALDWAVAKCEWNREEGDWRGTYRADYSTDWAQGGPIIEKYGIQVGLWDTWEARIFGDEYVTFVGEGDTPLIAAMRCVVLATLGEEIEIPEELK